MLRNSSLFTIFLGWLPLVFFGCVQNTVGPYIPPSEVEFYASIPQYEEVNGGINYLGTKEYLSKSSKVSLRFQTWWTPMESDTPVYLIKSIKFDVLDYSGDSLQIMFDFWSEETDPTLLNLNRTDSSVTWVYKDLTDEYNFYKNAYFRISLGTLPEGNTQVWFWSTMDHVTNPMKEALVNGEEKVYLEIEFDEQRIFPNKQEPETIAGTFKGIVDL